MCWVSSHEKEGETVKPNGSLQRGFGRSVLAVKYLLWDAPLSISDWARFIHERSLVQWHFWTSMKDAFLQKSESDFHLWHLCFSLFDVRWLVHMCWLIIQISSSFGDRPLLTMFQHDPSNWSEPKKTIAGINPTLNKPTQTHRIHLSYPIKTGSKLIFNPFEFAFTAMAGSLTGNIVRTASSRRCSHLGHCFSHQSGLDKALWFPWMPSAGISHENHQPNASTCHFSKVKQCYITVCFLTWFHPPVIEKLGWESVISTDNHWDDNHWYIPFGKSIQLGESTFFYWENSL